MNSNSLLLRMLLRALAAGVVLSLLCSLALSQAPKGKDQAAPAASAELIDLKLSSQKELLQKDVERLNEKIAATDKRVDDALGQTSQAVDRFTVIVSVLGTLVTALLFIGGWAAYFTVQRKAKEDATEAAEKASRQWFEAAETSHQTRIDQLGQSFKTKTQSLEDSLSQLLSDLHAQTSKAVDEARGKSDALLEELKSQSLEKLNLLPTDQSAALAARANAISAEPESGYTYDDWYTKAIFAYKASNFDDAVYYFDRASRSPGASAVSVSSALINKGITLGQLNRSEEAIGMFDEVDKRYGTDAALALREQVAMALFNKGFTLGQLNRSEEELAVYNEMDKRYGTDAALALREQVAKALVNKGFRLGRLNRREEAIAVFDEVDKRYGTDAALALRERVAKALFNKGNTLGQLNRIEEAIAVYDEVDKRYGIDAAPALRERVAEALNGKGFAKLCMAKANWADPSAKKLLVEAEAALAQAKLIDPDSAVVLGNMAYAAWLGGRQVEAEQYFTQALRGVGGGAVIHKDTYGDFDIHAIPLDQGFRVLIDRLYAQWQVDADSAASPVTTAFVT